jgi:hypothetical protein
VSTVLNSFDSAGGEPPPPEHTGLYHVAFVYPDRDALAGAVQRVLAQGHPIGSGSTTTGGPFSSWITSTQSSFSQHQHRSPAASIAALAAVGAA